MVQISCKSILRVVGCVVGLISICLIVGTLIFRDDKIPEEKFLINCKQNEYVKMSELTDFEWDIAYIDYEYYKMGEGLKSKYGIQGNFKELVSDNLFRIAFCKENQLVFDMILNVEDVQFDRQIDYLKPEMILFSQLKETTNVEILYLSKK